MCVYVCMCVCMYVCMCVYVCKCVCVSHLVHTVDPRLSEPPWTERNMLASDK